MAGLRRDPTRRNATDRLDSALLTAIESLEYEHVKHIPGKICAQLRGASGRERAKRMSARAARPLALARRAWQHGVTRTLADKAHTVAITALRPEAMTRKGQGGKRGLNREIRKTGWGALRQMLGYKADAVVEIDPAHTQQTCSACGVVDADSRHTQASIKCTACGHAQNADLNAARNILASATDANARRKAFGFPNSTTREMEPLVLRQIHLSPIDWIAVKPRLKTTQGSSSEFLISGQVEVKPSSTFIRVSATTWRAPKIRRRHEVS